MNRSSATVKQQLERAVVRAAFACLDGNGWMFQTCTSGPYPLKPDAMRRLENALARLKKARKK